MTTTKRSEQLAEIIEWPSLPDTARQLGISLNRTYHLVWNGKLTAIKIAGSWRVSPAAIEERLAKKAQR